MTQMTVGQKRREEWKLVLHTLNQASSKVEAPSNTYRLIEEAIKIAKTNLLPPTTLYDCESAALLEEPRFMLLARDRHAPARVEEWANSRELEVRRGFIGDTRLQAAELLQIAAARDIAKAMPAWRAANNGVWRQEESGVEKLKLGVTTVVCTRENKKCINTTTCSMTNRCSFDDTWLKNNPLIGLPL